MLKIENFEYYKIIQEEIHNKRANITVSKNPEKNTSGLDKIAHMHAIGIVNKKIQMLYQSENKVDNLKAKQLKLERKYMRTKERNELHRRIELKTNMPAGGSYTLAEIGKVLNLSRERARQLESAGIKVLKSPRVAKILKDYKIIAERT